MSLVYILLGAKKVVSIDIDTTSIACAEHLRKAQDISPEQWEIVLCSILDEESIKSL
jgi:predicted RNA methylase